MGNTRRLKEETSQIQSNNMRKEMNTEIIQLKSFNLW